MFKNTIAALTLSASIFSFSGIAFAEDDEVTFNIKTFMDTVNSLVKSKDNPNMPQAYGMVTCKARPNDSCYKFNTGVITSDPNKETFFIPDSTGYEIYSDDSEENRIVYAFSQSGIVEVFKMEFLNFNGRTRVYSGEWIESGPWVSLAQIHFETEINRIRILEKENVKKVRVDFMGHTTIPSKK